METLQACYKFRMLESFQALWANFPKEHLHPLVVHFPIGLWAIGTILFLVSLIGWFYWLRIPAIIVGVLGSLMGWLAVETGEIAVKIVGSGVCDHALLKAHEQQAESAQIFFAVCWTVAAVFQFVQNKFLEGREAHVLIRVGLALGLILGTAYLVMAGHKGFQLVYDQGVAVRGATSQCR